MRLIDADKMIDSLNKEIKVPEDYNPFILQQAYANRKWMIEKLKKEPTVDAVKRRSGCWELHDIFSLMYMGMCSVCKNPQLLDIHDVKGSFEDLKENYKFCPSCGARME